MVATNRAGVKELRGIARNCARRRTVGEPGEEGRVVRTFRERRRWVARQRERQELGDGVLDECEAEGERVADESVLIGEERAQVVAVAERQGGFVDGIRGEGQFSFHQPPCTGGKNEISSPSLRTKLSSL